MEKMDINETFWINKKVFITGHTGFKGTWLSIWLHSLGAIVTGYSLSPPTKPNMFEITSVVDDIQSIIGDIRDLNFLKKTIEDFQPEIIFHLAAQPLVRDSYNDPIETYSTNVMGTVNLLNILREIKSVRSIVVITTDKCYENRESIWGYRETDPMGGYDPYSNSKGCVELVCSSFKMSYFNPKSYNIHKVGLATARAGNVIGGGDWAKDRLMTDLISSFIENKKILIRNPFSIRPWQHVLEPLRGYIILAQKLYNDGHIFSEPWNFGPAEDDAITVNEIVQKMIKILGFTPPFEIDQSEQLHEATILKLETSKARSKLNWFPKFKIDDALFYTVDWYLKYKGGFDMKKYTQEQIINYQNRNKNE
jgi:CDP-glucose 4,6-dehydratase